jgi:hypothetical protein
MSVERVYCATELPEVSVIIPTWDGLRGGNVPLRGPRKLDHFVCEDRRVSAGLFFRLCANSSGV